MVSKKPLPERKDYEWPLSVEEKDKQALSESFGQMNAITRGVEARLDWLIGHSKIVTQRTIDIGRQLGVPEKEIQRWAALRSMHNSTRDKVIKQAPSRHQSDPSEVSLPRAGRLRTL